MQATRSRGQLRARQRTQGAGSSGGSAATAAAAGAAPPAADTVPACRICWLEADGEAGGALLEPCRCSGSSRYVHERCLTAWMHSVAASKGAHRAQQCDICLGRYRLPARLRIREPPQQYLQRQVAALRASPAGTAASYYAAAGLAFSVAASLRGAWCSVQRLPSLVRTAQQQPLSTLPQLLLPDVLVAMATEACLSGQWRVPLDTAAGYLKGLLLHDAACWAQAQAAAAVPPVLLPLAMGACIIAKAVANLLQYTNMALLLLFGGLGKGFAKGALLAARAPLWLVAKAACCVRYVAVAAAGTLGLPRRSMQARRCCTSSGGDGGGSSGGACGRRAVAAGQEQQQQQAQQAAAAAPAMPIASRGRWQLPAGRPKLSGDA